MSHLSQSAEPALDCILAHSSVLARRLQAVWCIELFTVVSLVIYYAVLVSNIPTSSGVTER